MAAREKSAWIMLVLAVASYATYLIIVLGAAQGRALSEVDYVPAMLWTIGGSIIASMVLHALAGVYTGRDSKPDERDKQIDRFGEYTGQAFLVIGALAALVMAMLELEHFWIANALYLSFALSAALGSMAKIGSYREGLQ